jgi:hypothetical protein
VARALPMENAAPHRGPTHAPAVLRLQRRGACRERRIGVRMHPAASVRYGGRVAAGPPTAGLGAGADGPRAPAPSEELLDNGLTDAKEGGHRALGAEPVITGAEALRSQVQGGRFHADEHNSVLPSRQSRTALGTRPAKPDFAIGPNVTAWSAALISQSERDIRAIFILKAERFLASTPHDPPSRVYAASTEPAIAAKTNTWDVGC